MIPRSFTVRLALVSTALSGAVLVLFAIWGLTLVRQSTLARVDDELREFARRHLAQPAREPRPWDRIEANFAEASATRGAVILLVIGDEGRPMYRSANWPAALAAGEFPQPSERHETRPPRRGSREQWNPGPPPGDMHRPDDRPPHDPRHDPRFDPGPPPPGETPSPGRDPNRPPSPPYREPPPPPPEIGQPKFQTRTEDGVTWRILAMGSPFMTIAVGRDLDPLASQMRGLYLRFGASAAGALALMAIAGWVVARRALRPVAMLTKTARSVTAKALHERIAISNADTEFARLIEVFNGMLDRLEKGFAQATRFSADAAHELNTPLTILQGEIERGIHRAADDSEDQRRYGKLLEEVQRLRSIVRKLLLLSLADSGQLKLNREPVNVTAMIQSAVEDARILSPDLRIDLEPGDPVIVPADPALLQQVVQNLLTNACKYNVPGGKMKCRLRTNDGAFEFSIVNTGPSIPPPDQPRIFDRFYRVDMARSRAEGGIGLGLSLSREIARAHGGELALVKSDERGTEFQLTLPLR